jgi:hypothetical protein
MCECGEFNFVTTDCGNEKSKKGNKRLKIKICSLIKKELRVGNNN